MIPTVKDAPKNNVPPAAMSFPKSAPVRRKRSKKTDKQTEFKPEDMVHHLSPHHPLEIPCLLRSGQAFAYTGTRREQISQAIGERIVIAATNTGTAGTVFGILRASSLGVVSQNVGTIATLAFSDSSGTGPTSSRAMKCGVSLTNETPVLNRGGRITFLNSQSRIRIADAPSSLTLATFNSIVNTINQFPTSQSFDATHFGETREFTSNVVDQQRYHDFAEFAGGLTIDEFYRHIAVWPLSGVSDRPMSTMFIIIAAPTAAQEYTLSCSASYYTRWPVDTVVGQAQKDIPVATHETVNRIHAIADHMAHVVHTVHDVGTRFGPMLAPLAEYGFERAGLMAMGA